MEEWDKIAWTCMHYPRWSNKKFSLGDFHPLRESTSRIQIARMKKWMEEMSKILADELNEEQRLAMFEKRIGRKIYIKKGITHGGSK